MSLSCDIITADSNRVMTSHLIRSATSDETKAALAERLVVAFCQAEPGSPIFQLPDTQLTYTAALGCLRKYLTKESKDEGRQG